MIDETTKTEILEELEKTVSLNKFMNKKTTEKEIWEIVEEFHNFTLKKDDRKEIRIIIDEYLTNNNILI